MVCERHRALIKIKLHYTYYECKINKSFKFKKRKKMKKKKRKGEKMKNNK